MGWSRGEREPLGPNLDSSEDKLPTAVSLTELGSSCCSAAQSCPTHCDPGEGSSPGFPVLHLLPEFTQTHVLGVSDAIQPTHPLSSPSPLALNLSSIMVFSNESALHIKSGQSIGASASILPMIISVDFL